MVLEFFRAVTRTQGGKKRIEVKLTKFLPSLARVPVFQQHRNHLAKVSVEFIQGFRLRMSTRKTRHVSDEQTRRCIPFNYRRECFHSTNFARLILSSITQTSISGTLTIKTESLEPLFAAWGEPLKHRVRADSGVGATGWVISVG